EDDRDEDGKQERRLPTAEEPHRVAPCPNRPTTTSPTYPPPPPRSAARSTSTSPGTRPAWRRPAAPSPPAASTRRPGSSSTRYPNPLLPEICSTSAADG